jgi:hypothetical protein
MRTTVPMPIYIGLLLSTEPPAGAGVRVDCPARSGLIRGLCDYEKVPRLRQVVALRLIGSGRRRGHQALGRRPVTGIEWPRSGTRPARAPPVPRAPRAPPAGPLFRDTEITAEDPGHPAGSMAHRAGCNRLGGTSSRPEPARERPVDDVMSGSGGPGCLAHLPRATHRMRTLLRNAYPVAPGLRGSRIIRAHETSGTGEQRGTCTRPAPPKTRHLKLCSRRADGVGRSA